MDFKFTLYEPKRERISHFNNPLIEINPSGRIIFNQKASELLSSHGFCMLGYDPQNKALGILPIENQKVNAFTIRYANRGAYIGAKKFFNHFRILPEKSMQLPPMQTGEFISIPLS